MGKKYLNLFLTFFKIGLFTFGGGYAMIPLIEHECVEKKQWISQEDMMNLTTIAESTPGPIAINCATFVGYKQAKLCGSIFATLGVILPSFLIILFISFFLNQFLEIEVVANAFHGIKIAVSILIFLAGMKMITKMKKNRLLIFLMLLSFILLFCINYFSLSFSSIFIMIISGLLSLSVFSFKQKESKNDHLS